MSFNSTHAAALLLFVSGLTALGLTGLVIADAGAREAIPPVSEAKASTVEPVPFGSISFYSAARRRLPLPRLPLATAGTMAERLDAAEHADFASNPQTARAVRTARVQGGPTPNRAR